MAAQSSVPHSFSHPHSTYEINFLGTLNLLESLKETRFDGRILYISSSDVYGKVNEKNMPIREMAPLRPRNPYSVSKVAAESLCYQWSQTENMDIVIARPFNHIGPGQDNRFAVASFAQQISQIVKGIAEPIITVGDLDVGRDFTDVRDVVMAYSMLLDSGESGEVYNVCSGVSHKLSEILYRLITISDCHVSVSIDDEKLRPSEQKNVVGDFGKLFSETGWRPKTSLDDSLKDTYNYWMNS